MGQTRVHEDIDVSAIFVRGHVVPRAFRWSGRMYQIAQVNQQWSGQNGTMRLQYFAVTADGNAYKLCFNTHACQWMLEEVYA